MRRFGISLKVIQNVKNALDEAIDLQQALIKQKEQLLEGMMSNLSEEGYSPEEIEKIASVLETGELDKIIQIQSSVFTFMDLLIFILISTRNRVGILLF